MAVDSSQSHLYLKGVFTTIRVIDGQPVFWEKHWRRLRHDAAVIGIDLSSLSGETAGKKLATAIVEKSISYGMVRISLADERSGELWTSEREAGEHTSFHVLARPARILPKEFRLTFSPYPVNSRSPLAGVKSCNYLENILAINEARERGFHEAVRVNEHGHITGGCMSNVVWLKGERLYTPALSTGCLPGTTREFVLENLKCEEVETAIGELETAEAIYLTSAGLGIVAVNELDGRGFAGGDHPILRLWRDLETK